MNCKACGEKINVVYVKMNEGVFHQSPKCIGNLFYDMLETELEQHNIPSGIAPMCSEHDIDVVEFGDEADCIMCGRPCTTKMVYIPIKYEITNFY